MKKILVIIISLWFVANICSSELTESVNSTIIKIINDKEIEQQICNSPNKDSDIETSLNKLQKCIRQKTKEKMLKKKVKRSIEDQINMDKLTKKLKQFTESIQKNTTDDKLNIFVGIAETNSETTTLKCDTQKKIKILNAVLSSKNYNDKCDSLFDNVNKEKELITVDLNEFCDEKINTMINTAKMCDGKNECKIDIDTAYTGICDCTQNKYADITYVCVDTKTKIRSKRALHYRNKPLEIVPEINFRQMLARAQGLDILLNGYNYPVDYYPYY